MNPDDFLTLCNSVGSSYILNPKPKYIFYNPEQINELDALETNKMSYSKLFSINEFSSAIRSKQFIVGSVSTERGVSFSHNPTAHTTRSSARTECNRLAKLSPGRLYVFVELAGGELLPASTTVSI